LIFDYFGYYRTEPPRPSPGAVLYSPEDEPPGYDSSSVTEKEELSSDDETKVSAGHIINLKFVHVCIYKNWVIHTVQFQLGWAFTGGKLLVASTGKK